MIHWVGRKKIMKIRPADSRQWYADNGDATLRQEYDLTEHSVVFDIGASVGDWCVPMYNRYKCNIHAFEPTDLYKTCYSRIWDKPKVKLYKKAAYNYDGLLNLGIDENEASIYHDTNILSVECIDFKKFIRDNNFNEIDLIKINIEGAEYPLLLDLIDGGVIGAFRNMQIQFHIIEGFESQYDVIAQKLSATHHLTWRYPFVWENWSRNVNS